MSKIPANDLISLFERMYSEHWDYVYSSAKEGAVDCSGAFVWAYKQFGKKIDHGSNSILRKACGKLRPMSEVKPGMACFKIRQDGGEPAKFRSDGIGNAYHIGLADKTGHVLNAQSTRTGFVRSTTSSWNGCAYLNDVDYGEAEQMSQTIIGYGFVKTESGALNVRSGPGTNYNKKGSLPKGTKIDVLEDDGEWLYIRYGTLEGYVMASYIEAVCNDVGTDHDEDEASTAAAVYSTIIILAGKRWVIEMREAVD